MWGEPKNPQKTILVTPFVAGNKHVAGKPVEIGSADPWTPQGFLDSPPAVPSAVPTGA